MVCVRDWHEGVGHMDDEKTNWELIRDQDPHDAVEHRDVFNEQQLERSQLAEKKTMRSRTILTGAITLFLFLALWFMMSFGSYLVDGNSMLKHDDTSTYVGENGLATWYAEEEYEDSEGNVRVRYAPIDENGEIVGSERYDAPEEIEKPEWWENATRQESAHTEESLSREAFGFGHYLMPSVSKVVLCSLLSLTFFMVFYLFMMRNLDAQNALATTDDINQYKDDRRLQLPEEIQRTYDWFPDAGAHSSVVVSSMLSHMALSNKGLNKIEFADRVKEDVVDEEGFVIQYKGEILEDEDGDPVTHKVPMIDEEYAEALFDASGALNDKETRIRYDTTRIPYNPGNENRAKLKGYDTVADLINGDWEVPLYEPQRPGGAYIVDTDPVNTMVLAITRAGKGQTVIEPTLDMWTRERNPNNMVINDPKGELLVKNYVKATVRGFQPVQFNLINSLKTDIYNPLLMAAESAREGDFTKAAMYVENIAEVFFPVDGAEDPLWPNAANNAFKRAAYGLMDYYLEKERELRLEAERTGMEPKVLATKLDRLWGHVTLYNCYQLFVQLTSKKRENPATEFTRRAKAGEFNEISDAEYEKLLAKAEAEAELWDGKPDADLLTLYFNATAKLPRNQMRVLVANADNALRAIGGADKMLASVYGIAITAMSFFTDPTISTLTSGTPSQNVDLAGLSFPRRLGVRFHSDFIAKYNMVAMQARWQAYADDTFETSLGPDFYHEDLVTREGWARYYFKGKFAGERAYLKLDVVNPETGLLIRTFRFKFTKGYQTSLDGRVYVKDPVLGEKMVHDGTLVELTRYRSRRGGIIWRPGATTFKSRRLVDIETEPRIEDYDARAIISTMARYSEKPKMVFLVTPPHLQKYAKLILILIKQLVDLNFDQSYMTKSNQKPLYKTRFMLDELGNLQSEGHGIANFSTMLSIGLGQEQQFTIILQTLQQLRDVYGESVDKIVQGNAQPLSSRIATPDGWKTMGEMREGTEVLTPRGTKTQVKGVYPCGVRKVYRVTRKDGASCLVCGQHLFKVRVR